MDVSYIDSYFYPRLLGPQFPSPSLPCEQQAPTAPLPAFIGQQQIATPFAVNPGAISFCLFRNTCIWLRNRASF
jgi:hypothetical protein